MASLPGNAVFRTVTYPSEIVGEKNGKLPTADLVKVTYPGGGTGTFCKTAARAFAAMLDAMGKAGFKMMTVGGYRSYEQQVTLFTSRYYQVQYDSGIWWNGHYWEKRAGVAVAAIPGTSNHGWGLADDMAENLDTDPSAESISQKAVDWLVKNADRFGISAELRSEAWHWRYYKGNDIPQAVLDYENGSSGEDLPVDQKEFDKLFLNAINNPSIRFQMVAIPWQYVGGGIPKGASTLSVLNDTYLGVKALATAVPADLVTKLNAILAAALDDGDTTVVLPPEAIAELEELKAAIEALPDATEVRKIVDEELDEQSRGGADTD